MHKVLKHITESRKMHKTSARDYFLIKKVLNYTMVHVELITGFKIKSPK